jgi:hypothetical protein
VTANFHRGSIVVAAATKTSLGEAVRATRSTSLVSVAVIAVVALGVAVATLLVPTLEASFGAASRSRITTSWSSTNVKLGTPATVKGRVTSPRLQRRTVSLYVSLKSGWRRVGWTTSGPRGYYSLKVPTDYYRARPMQLRVRAVKGARSVTSATRTITVAPTYAPTGSASAWSRQTAGEERRFNPCQVVTYRVNDAQAVKPGALADVQAAFAQLHEATGITFRYLGTTTAFPEGPAALPADTNITVAWGQDTDTDWDLSGGALSTSGVLTSRAARDTQGAVRRILTAGVFLNAAEDNYSTSMRQGILLHELGHTLGLGHTADTNQRMEEDVWDGESTRWGAGDLAGLNRVGLVEGCVTG